MLRGWRRNLSARKAKESAAVGSEHGPVYEWKVRVVNADRIAESAGELCMFFQIVVQTKATSWYVIKCDGKFARLLDTYGAPCACDERAKGLLQIFDPVFIQLRQKYLDAFLSQILAKADQDLDSLARFLNPLMAPQLFIDDTLGTPCDKEGEIYVCSEPNQDMPAAKWAWKKKWGVFVRGFLYFVDEKESQKMAGPGIISLHVSSVCIIEHESTIGNGEGRKGRTKTVELFPFVVRSGYEEHLQQYFLAAPDVEDRRAWMNLIRRASTDFFYIDPFKEEEIAEEKAWLFSPKERPGSYESLRKKHEKPIGRRKALTEVEEMRGDIVYSESSALFKPVEEKQGWLTKQGAAVKNWKERWFRLYKEGYILYFETEVSSKPLGRIELDGASMTPSHEVLKFEKIKENHFGWVLHTQQRDFPLYSLEEKDRTEWMAAIQVVIDNSTMKERRGLFLRNSSQSAIVDLPNRRESLDYPKQPDPDARTVQGGTLAKLIDVLLSNECDTVYFKTFLLTYNSFTTPEILFEELTQRFLQEEDCKKVVSDEHVITRKRICIVLRHWIAVSYLDFSVKLKSSLMHFIERVLANEQCLADETVSIREVIGFQMGKETDFQEIFSFTLNFKPTPLFDFSLKKIAAQLTLLEFDKFRRIQAHEFLNQSWNKAHLKHRAPSLVSLIGHFNRLSVRVSNSILSFNALTGRVQMIEKWVKIAELCRGHNNLASVMAITSGINNAVIYRLKKTWAKVSYETKKALEKLLDTFDPRNSYRNYREAIRKTKTPCVPYMGVFLSDLTFLDENADTLTSSDGSKELINFGKRRRIYEVISQILYFRDFPYSLSIDQTIGCSLIFFLSDSTMPQNYDQLQLISLKLEPREETNNNT